MGRKQRRVCFGLRLLVLLAVLIVIAPPWFFSIGSFLIFPSLEVICCCGGFYVTNIGHLFSSFWSLRCLQKKNCRLVHEKREKVVEAGTAADWASALGVNFANNFLLLYDLSICRICVRNQIGLSFYVPCQILGMKRNNGQRIRWCGSSNAQLVSSYICWNVIYICLHA